MCWISDHAELLTAKHEVVVFKVCLQHIKTKKLVSYYFKEPYTLGKLKRQSIIVDKAGNEFVIESGLHCYNTNAFSCSKNLLVLNVAPYPHFYNMEGYVAVVVRGYIPKGATYYLNEYHEIATNKLVLTDIIDLPQHTLKWKTKNLKLD